MQIRKTVTEVDKVLKPLHDVYGRWMNGGGGVSRDRDDLFDEAKDSLRDIRKDSPDETREYLRRIDDMVEQLEEVLSIRNRQTSNALQKYQELTRAVSKVDEERKKLGVPLPNLNN
ncbi:MAG: hypothetical protein HKN23_14040 [Verrucomicrobiales bacterium]|nr:hypothetical protein [Verrucomicrobiales bacterium]